MAIKKSLSALVIPRQSTLHRARLSAIPAELTFASKAGLRLLSDEQRGGDPYNTSGSFDRSRAWERVGKR